MGERLVRALEQRLVRALEQDIVPGLFPGPSSSPAGLRLGKLEGLQEKA